MQLMAMGDKVATSDIIPISKTNYSILYALKMLGILLCLDFHMKTLMQFEIHSSEACIPAAITFAATMSPYYIYFMNL